MMKLEEIKKAKVWIASEKRLLNLLDLPLLLDEVEYDENYTILRRSAYVDRYNKPIYEGHILRINPMDDDWFDVVIYKKYLRSINTDDPLCTRFEQVPANRLELSRFEEYNSTTALDLESAVSRDNPAEIVGHAITHPHLLFKTL
jgi:hypothetical protein